MKRKAKADKREFMEILANQVAASKGWQGKVYKIIKIVCGKYHGTTDTPIRQARATSNNGGRTRSSMVRAFQRSLEQTIVSYIV